MHAPADSGCGRFVHDNDHDANDQEGGEAEKLSEIGRFPFSRAA